MTAKDPKSPWQIPLVREISVILLLKLVILFSIKAIWFTEPVVPANGTARLDAHLFNTSAPHSSPSAEEKPR